MFSWPSFCLLCRFIKGLQVKHAALSEELKQSIGLEPTPKGISYIISTKVHTSYSHSCYRQQLKDQLLVVLP